MNDGLNLEPLLKNIYTKKIKKLPYDPRGDKRSEDMVDKILKPKGLTEKKESWSKIKRMVEDYREKGQ
jgi:hypothetical protein